MPIRPTLHRTVPRSSTKQWDKGIQPKQRISGSALQQRNKRIHMRDQFTCQNKQCNIVTTDLEVDHRVAVTAGGTDNDMNLRCLCVMCHSIKTKIESIGRQLPNPDSFPLTYIAAKRLTSHRTSNELPIEADDHDGVVNDVFHRRHTGGE